MSKKHYWGYLPEVKVEFDGQKQQLINNIIVSAISHIPIRNTIINTESTVTPESLELPEDAIKPDRKVLDAIELIKYANETRDDIETLSSNPFEELDECNTCGKSDSFPIEMKESTKKFKLMKEKNTNFVNGICTNTIPEISADTARQLLQKATATLLAHAGFTECTELSLNVLTDVTEMYTKKVCQLLNVNAEKFLLSDDYGFQDAISRTCQEAGIGSIKNLFDFYQESVINYRKNKLSECLELKEMKWKMEDEKRKLNIISNEMEIPELHVPNDDSILVESFETGYQMLEELENQHLSHTIEA